MDSRIIDKIASGAKLEIGHQIDKLEKYSGYADWIDVCKGY